MKLKTIHWGGEGPQLHLAHANSFHPGTYVEIIDTLRRHFRVSSVLLRPLNPNSDPEEVDNWDILRDDLIETFDANGWSNVIGMGHSLGSTVTMMASIKRPDLFSKLVIIEPPCIEQIFFTLLSITPYRLAKHLVPPSKTALKRRHKFPSREVAFQLFRQKRIFNSWSDTTLKAYVEYGLFEDEEGDFRLAFSKFWESKIYCTIENPYRLFPKVITPALCIRAGDSDVINDKNWKKWQRLHSEATFVSIPDTGHLVPMEQPDIVAKEILAFA